MQWLVKNMIFYRDEYFQYNLLAYHAKLMESFFYNFITYMYRILVKIYVHDVHVFIPVFSQNFCNIINQNVVKIMLIQIKCSKIVNISSQSVHSALKHIFN